MTMDENSGELSEGELEEGELLSSDEEETSADKNKEPPPTENSSKQHTAEVDDQPQRKEPNRPNTQNDKHTLKADETNSEEGEIFSDDEEAAYYPERVKSRSSEKKSSPEKRPTSDVENRISDRESSQSRDRHHSRDRDRESWQMSPGSESSKDDKDTSSLFYEDREGKPSDEEQEGHRERKRPWDRDKNRERHYSSPGPRHGRREVMHDRSDDVNRSNRDSSHYNRSGGYSSSRKGGGFTRQRPYGIKSSRFSPYESYTPSQMNTGVTPQQFHMLSEKVASRRQQGLPLLPTPSRKPKSSNLDHFNYPAAPTWYIEAVEEWEAKNNDAESESVPPQNTGTDESVQSTNVTSLMVTDVSSDEEDHKQKFKESAKPEPLMNIVTNVNFIPPVTDTIRDQGNEQSELQEVVPVADGNSGSIPMVSEAPPLIQPKIKPLFEVNFEPADSAIAAQKLPVVEQPPPDTVTISDAASSSEPTQTDETNTVSLSESAQKDQSDDKAVETMDTQDSTPSLIVTSQSVQNVPELITDEKRTTDNNLITDRQATPDTPIAPLIITSDTPTTPPSMEVEHGNYQLRPRKSSNTVSSEGNSFRPKLPSDSDNEVNYEDYLDQLDQEEEEEDTNDDVVPSVFSGVFPLADATVKDSSNDKKPSSISELVLGTVGGADDENDDPFNEDFPAISSKQSQPADQSLLSLVGHAKSTVVDDDVVNKTRLSGRHLHKKSVWMAKQKEKDKQKQLAVAERAQTVCKYFLNGSCKNGENCQYMHVASAKKKEVCKFYLQDSCTKGDSCHYYHGDFPCKFYHSKMSHCKNGSLCKFSHAPLTPTTRELLASIIDQPLSDHPPSTLQQIIPIHSAPGGDFKIPRTNKTATAATTESVVDLDKKQLVISIPKHIATVDDSLIVSIPLTKLPPGRFKQHGSCTVMQAQSLGTGNQAQVTVPPPPLFANQQPPLGPCPPVPMMPLPPQSQPIPLFPPKIDPTIIEQPSPVIPGGPLMRKVLLPMPPPQAKISPQEFMRMKPVEYWEAPELSQQQQKMPNQQFPPFVDNAPPPPHGKNWPNANQPPSFQGHPPQTAHQWGPPMHDTGSNAGTGMEQRPGIGMGHTTPGIGTGQMPPGMGMDDPRYSKTNRGPIDTRRFDHEPNKPILPSSDHSSMDPQMTRPPWPASVSPPPPTHQYHQQQTGVSNFKTDMRPGLMVHPNSTPPHGPPPSDPLRIVSGGHMSPPQQFQSLNKVSPVWGKSPEHSTGNVGVADHVRRVDPRRKYSHLKIKSKSESSQQTSSSSILKKSGREGTEESSAPGFKIPKLLQNPNTLEKPLDPRDLFGGKDGDNQEYGDYTAPFGTFKSSFFTQSQGSSSSQETESTSSSQKFGEITLENDNKTNSDDKSQEKSSDVSTKDPPKNQVPSYFAHLDVGLDSDLKIDSAFGSLSEEGKAASDGEEVKVQDSQARKLPSIFGMGL